MPTIQLFLQKKKIFKTIYICSLNIQNYYKSKKGGKDQDQIQSSPTPDPCYHMGSNKNTINITKKSQEDSPFQEAGNTPELKIMLKKATYNGIFD